MGDPGPKKGLLIPEDGRKAIRCIKKVQMLLQQCATGGVLLKVVKPSI
jgi:hypothetical protein